MIMARFLLLLSLIILLLFTCYQITTTKYIDVTERSLNDTGVPPNNETGKEIPVPDTGCDIEGEKSSEDVNKTNDDNVVNKTEETIKNDDTTTMNPVDALALENPEDSYKYNGHDKADYSQMDLYYLKPGFCPDYEILILGPGYPPLVCPPKDTICLGDSRCPGDMKCCPNQCGDYCMHPTNFLGQREAEELDHPGFEIQPHAKRLRQVTANVKGKANKAKAIAKELCRIYGVPYEEENEHEFEEESDDDDTPMTPREQTEFFDEEMTKFSKRSEKLLEAERKKTGEMTENEKNGVRKGSDDESEYHYVEMYGVEPAKKTRKHNNPNLPIHYTDGFDFF